MLGKGANFAKRKAKQFTKQLIKKLAKKVAMVVIKLIKTLVLKFIGILVAAFGWPFLLALFAVVIIGGALIFVWPLFGWWQADGGSPLSPTQLSEKYKGAVIGSSWYEEYRPPLPLVQQIDSLRLIKNGLDPWRIDPDKIVSRLKPDITMKMFTETYETTIITHYMHSDTNSPNDQTGNSSGISPPAEQLDNVAMSEGSSDVTLLTDSHAWNRVVHISYKQEKTTSASSYSDSDGNVITEITERDRWVVDQKTVTPDFSKLDTLLVELRFTNPDFDMLVSAADGNNQNYLNDYIGMFGELGVAKWWDDSAVGTGNWIWPTISRRITSGFYKRIDPINGEIAMHDGLDIGRPMVEGKFDNRPQPIFAAADGVVKVAGEVQGFGNAVYIDHGHGVVIIYGHLKKIDNGIEVGKEIKVGTLVGIMGSSGRSTGVHLHFQVNVNSRPADPLLYLHW